METKDIEKLKGLFKTKIEDCELTVRSMNYLKYAGIGTIGELCKWKASDLIKQRNFGNKSLLEIEDFLTDKGLTFGMDVDSIMNQQPTSDVTGNKEYWLFSLLMDNNMHIKCFYDHFPSHAELKRACEQFNATDYFFICIRKLTEEQYKLLQE